MMGGAWKIMFVLCLLSLSGCGSMVTISPTIPSTPDPPRDTPTIPQIDTPTPDSRECGWNWASEGLPEVTAQLNQALSNAGLEDVEGRAAAYGENCVASDGTVVRFAVMQTDFYLSTPVKDIEDAAEMGDWLAKALPVVEQFPPGKVPGSNLGYVGVRFMGPGGDRNLWLPRKTIQDALSGGLRGKELFEKLSARP